MSNRHNLPVNGLLILISLLAMAGGVITVLVTSPLSFDLARAALLQSIIAPESTPTLTATPTLTPVPASPTTAPTATTSQQVIAYLPTGTDTPTGQPTGASSPSPSATATPTGLLLADDVQALAIVTNRVGAQLVRVHDSPNGAQIVAVIPGGTVVQVLFGSAMVDGVEWLPVRLGSGRGGWIAGYLLTITLERAGGTSTSEAPATEPATSTAVPATAQPGSTNHPAPPPPASTAAPNPTDTPLAPADRAANKPSGHPNEHAAPTAKQHTGPTHQEQRAMSINKTQPADMARSRAWSAQLFEHAAALPISFTFDGKSIHGLPADWVPAISRRRIDANIIETVFEGTDPASGLKVRVEVTHYQDYPVIEWVAWFSNTGSAPTPIIQDIQAIDLSVHGAGPILTHSNGDFNSADGYTPRATTLAPGNTLAMAPVGGRACDQAFPYFRLAFEDWGLTLAVGWPAQWAARFIGTASGVELRAGQEKTHLRVMPGERIRTPRITVLTWAGDDTRAVNLWRRWYLAHILPRPNGQPMPTLLACAATEAGEEFTAASEANQIRFIDAFREHGIRPDVWWIDAGWYPCYDSQHMRKWPLTGTWQPDAERFPNGLKPISEHAVQGGADLLLWFEPERVAPGTQLALEHPEWLLSAVLGETTQLPGQLLFLGNPACRQWLTDHLCRQIQANGIKIYRQDHNFEPLEYWRQNEPDDRQGLNENLHVQGYLQLWDDLLARNPGLWINSCASGGRRNDLETMRRSVPLHYTDHGYGDPPVKLAFHRTLYEWIPYFKEFSLAWDLQGPGRFDHQVDSFSFHCGLAPMLFATLDIQRDDYDFALARQMIAIWRRAAGLLLHGDYYPHTPFHRGAGGWVAHQFDSPESGRGLVQAIRLPGSPREKYTVYPKGLRPNAIYDFEESETGETKITDGEAAMRDGLTLTLSPRSGTIWFYQTDHHPGEQS